MFKDLYTVTSSTSTLRCTPLCCGCHNGVGEDDGDNNGSRLWWPVVEMVVVMMASAN